MTTHTVTRKEKTRGQNRALPAQRERLRRGRDAKAPARPARVAATGARSRGSGRRDSLGLFLR